jgi:hypothetical protein
MMHVTLSQRLHQVEAEDGRNDATGDIRLFYSNFIIIYILYIRAL